MYFPWVGMFEQIRLANTFVFYDDVQFSKGSFTNRVQIKTANKEGFKWITVPIENLKLGIKINEAIVNDSKGWRSEHYSLLENSYKSTPYFTDMFELVHNVLEKDYAMLSDISVASMKEVCRYYNLNPDFFISSQMDIGGKSSDRVFEIVRTLSGSNYITGHGAKNYLDHKLFDGNGIDVQYMDYKKTPYPQILGDFNPYVSILDLIANTGKDGIQYINSSTKSWKEI
ncbi:MAG: WbqC family protein [Bacteroidota bacterium]